MKQMITDTMLMPTYVSRFTCIGGDCEDTCCAGWNVTLDKESYLRYQSCTDPVLKPLFSKHVKRDLNSKSAEVYGHLEFNQGGCTQCGFLTEQKRCIIQERLGEKALSDTCANFPRKIHRIGDLHQMTLSLSCPEAARLALLHEDAFGFVGDERTISQGFITKVNPRHGLTLVTMEDVRTLMFQILRSPDISLSNRLKLAGLFCERINEQIQKNQSKDLSKLLLTLENELDSGVAMAPLAGLPEFPEFQAQLAGAFFQAGQKAVLSNHSQKVIAEVGKGLGIQEGIKPEASALLGAYEKGLRRLAPALEAVPWLLEHYLLNEVLRECFPWGQANPSRHHAALTIQHLMTRFLLAGRAAASETILSPFELAETIQVSCRRYSHDTNFFSSANQTLNEAGWNSLERPYLFL